MKVRYIDAFTLDEMSAENGKQLTHDRVARCTPLRVKFVQKSKRYIFLVRCSEKWSDPKGHIVSLRFDSRKSLPMANGVDVRVFCSCPAHLYWGSAYLSTTLDYNLKEGTESRFPFIRDPGLLNTTCKHVLTVRQQVLNTISMKTLRSKYNLETVKTAEGIRTAARRVLSFEEFAVKETLRSLKAVPVDSCEGAVVSFLKRSGGFSDPEIESFVLDLDEDNFEDKLNSVGMLVKP